MNTSVTFELTGPLLTPALAFGAALDLLFFGILTVQVYIYYISFPTDRLLLKLAVTWVYLIGVAQTGLALLDVRISWITGLRFLRNASHMPSLSPDHLWLSITASTAAVVIAIQSLYAHRIYVISKNRWLASIIICMSVAQFVTGILGAVCDSQERVVYSETIFEEISKEELTGVLGTDVCHIGFIWIWGSINAACDLTITVCMVTFLLRHRRRTMRQKTRSNITRIVQIVVETGMATTVLMAVYTPLYIGPYFPLPGLMMGKIYSNSMLVLLNNRATISNGRNAMESFEFVEVPARGLEGDIQWRPTSSTELRSSNMQ